MKKIKKIKYLLGSYFYRLPLLFILLLLNTLIDFFSIGLVFPYLDIIINNKESSSIIYLDNLMTRKKEKKIPARQTTHNV